MGQSQKRKVKLHILRTVRRDASIFTMDWPGRVTEREVKLQLLRARSIFARDWRGRATERD